MSGRCGLLGTEPRSQRSCGAVRAGAQGRGRTGSGWPRGAALFCHNDLITLLFSWSLEWKEVMSSLVPFHFSFLVSSLYTGAGLGDKLCVQEGTGQGSGVCDRLRTRWSKVRAG